MTKINYVVWLLTMLWLVSGCKEGIKTPNSVDSSTTLHPQKQMEQPIAKPTQKENGAVDVYTQAAIETCNCMHPMVEKAKYLEELETNNQTTDMKRVSSEMAQLQPQIQKCSDEIRRKYGQINSSIEEKRILIALTTQCPNVKILFSYLEKMSNK